MVLKKRVFLTAMEITPQKGVEFEPNSFRGFSRNPNIFPSLPETRYSKSLPFSALLFLDIFFALKKLLTFQKKIKNISPESV